MHRFIVGQQNIPFEQSALDPHLQQVPPDPDDGDGAGDGLGDEPLPPPEEPLPHVQPHWADTNEYLQKPAKREHDAGLDSPLNLMVVGFASVQLEGVGRGFGLGVGLGVAGGVGVGLLPFLQIRPEDL